MEYVKDVYCHSAYLIYMQIDWLVGLVAKLCPILAAPQTLRQKYGSGLPFPSPGDLPDPGIEPGSPALQANSLLTEL